MSDITIRRADMVRLTDGSEGTVVEVRGEPGEDPKFLVELSGTEAERQMVSLPDIKEIVFQSPHA